MYSAARKGWPRKGVVQQQQDGQHGGGHWEKGHIAQQQPRGHETPVCGTAGLGDLHVFKLYVCCVLLQVVRDLLCYNIVCEAACCCMLGCIRYRGFCCWVFFSSCVSSWKLCVARWAASDIGALGRSWSPVGPKLPLPCWSRCTSALMLNPTLEMSPQQGLGCRCRKWRRRRYILSFTYKDWKWKLNHFDFEPLHKYRQWKLHFGFSIFWVNLSSFCRNRCQFWFYQPRNYSILLIFILPIIQTLTLISL